MSATSNEGLRLLVFALKLLKMYCFLFVRSQLDILDLYEEIVTFMSLAHGGKVRGK